MGIFSLFGTSSNSTLARSTSIGAPRASSGPLPRVSTDPRADSFTIKSLEQVNGWTIAVIEYKNCTNYSGMKLLVYPVKAHVVHAQELLDPHFLDDGNGLYPVARFEPTPLGRKMAETVCKNRGK